MKTSYPLFDLFTRKTRQKAGKNTAENSSNAPSATDVDSLEMNWFGLQYVYKVKGTGEIRQRSFPFWLTSIEEGIEHARKTNKLPKENRTYWTHLIVLSSITETKQGRRRNDIAVHEVQL